MPHSAQPAEMSTLYSTVQTQHTAPRQFASARKLDPEDPRTGGIWATLANLLRIRGGGGGGGSGVPKVAVQRLVKQTTHHHLRPASKESGSPSNILAFLAGFQTSCGEQHPAHILKQPLTRLFTPVNTSSMRRSPSGPHAVENGSIVPNATGRARSIRYSRAMR